MIRRTGRCCLILLLVVACGEPEPTPAELERERTRAIMEEIFGALQVALPASADVEDFGAPETRAEIAAALARLATNTKVLESHMRPKDLQMQFLARSVAKDAREAQRAYQEEHFERSAFLLQEITENCVVCHSRLPSPGDSPVAEDFLARGALAELPPEPRASLQIATRRFDAALASLEELMASDVHPAVMLGPLTDYLVISIRVKGDYERPLPALRRFVQRPDLWEQLRLDVQAWIDALPELAERAAGEPDLATARDLLTEAKGLSDHPDERIGRAHFVVASAILQRLIDASTGPSPELAEAYYLLGVTQARIGRNYWVTEAPFLLDASIRMAPQRTFARKAYSLLERELLLQYEGTDLEELPDEDAQRLSELRALMDAG